MSEDMVTRVASTMAGTYSVSALKPEGRELWLVLARAAIEAMLEPTEAVLDAGAVAEGDGNLAVQARNMFGPDAVEVLAYNQQSRALHPFTCPNRSDGEHRNAYGDKGALVATVRGWICPFCDYTQDWVHSFMSEQKREPFSFAALANTTTKPPEPQ